MKRTTMLVVALAFAMAANLVAQTRGVRSGASGDALPPGSYHALLFATDDYDSDAWADLVNPVFDAEALKSDLERHYGFDVDLVHNATKTRILNKIRQYATREWGDNDHLLIFFAGHGLYDEIDAEGYLVARDSDAPLDDPVHESYLPHSTLRQRINNIQVDHLLLVIDACFGGTFDTRVASRGSSDIYAEITPEQFLSLKLPYVTRQFITSGGKEYVSDGTPGRHSPFMRRFLEALRGFGGSDGMLTLAELMVELQRVQPQPVHGEWGDNEPGSDFIMLFGGAATVEQPARTPDPAPVETSDQSSRRPAEDTRGRTGGATSGGGGASSAPPTDLLELMNQAYEVATAGDPVRAMEMVRGGLDVDPNNVDLWEQYGGFAIAAALDAGEGAEPGEVSAQAAGYYREGVGALERVVAARGDQTGIATVTNAIAAYQALEDFSASLELAERFLSTHGGEPRLWMLYGDALHESDRLDEAVAAVDRALEIDPDTPNAELHQGSWLTEVGRFEDAVSAMSGVAARDSAQALSAAQLLFAEAYRNGYQQDDYAYTVRGLTAAKTLPNLSLAMKSQLDFWHGFSLYQSAASEQEPQTVASARSTLPRFQEAERLFQASGDYAASVNVNLAQLLENVRTYIEIQEAILRRGL